MPLEKEHRHDDADQREHVDERGDGARREDLAERIDVVGDSRDDAADGGAVEVRRTDLMKIPEQMPAQAVHHAVRAASRRRTISSTTVFTLRPSVSTVRSADSS